LSDVIVIILFFLDTAMEADASVLPVTRVSALSMPAPFSSVGVVGVLLEEEAEETERATPGSRHITVCTSVSMDILKNRNF
jgi:hypothetical protein